MTKKKKKVRNTDSNVTAFQIMRIATESATAYKNPAAVSLGRLGGLKGGPARSKKLDAEHRRQIASKAARARWAKKHNS